MIKIAVDCMGGDHAPGEIVRGAVEAAMDGSLELLLVGDPRQIETELSRYECPGCRMSIVPASEVIGPEEAPVAAVRRKKDASINVAINLIQENKAAAVISAGNTGAFMAASLFKLKRLPGIDRPALCPALPTRQPGRMVVLLDVGANMTASAQNLVQYGVMGSIYAERVLGVTTPRVGLLNVGTEENKGNSQIHEAYSLLKASQLNFTGNVEARDIFDGVADVVVCDGFVGNAVLKSNEGLAKAIFVILREEFSASLRARIGAALLRPVLKKVKGRLDYAEYGGAPFLGVNGVCIKSHGSSRARAIKNGILTGKRFVEDNILAEIEKNISQQEGEKDG